MTRPRSREDLAFDLLYCQRRIASLEKRAADRELEHRSDMRIARAMCLTLFWFGALSGAGIVYLWP